MGNKCSNFYDYAQQKIQSAKNNHGLRLLNCKT